MPYKLNWVWETSEEAGDVLSEVLGQEGGVWRFGEQVDLVICTSNHRCGEALRYGDFGKRFKEDLGLDLSRVYYSDPFVTLEVAVDGGRTQISVCGMSCQGACNIGTTAAVVSGRPVDRLRSNRLDYHRGAVGEQLLGFDVFDELKRHLREKIARSVAGEGDNG